MGLIHVRTLIEALDKPSTMKALVRKTGYPTDRVMETIREARVNGHRIVAVSRGTGADIEPTVFRLEVPDDPAHD